MGASTGPSSTEIATTEPSATGRSTGTTVASDAASKSPAGTGFLPPSITQTAEVLPSRLGKPATTSAASPCGRTSSRPRAPSSPIARAGRIGQLGDYGLRVVELARERRGVHAETDRDRGRHGCDSAEQRRRATSASRVERDDVLRLGSRRRDDAVAELRSGGGSDHRGRHGRRDPGQRAQLLPCLFGGREQLLRTRLIGLVEGVERVAGDQLVSLGVPRPVPVLAQRFSDGS